MQKKAPNDFSTGPVWRRIISQAVPLTIAQLVHLLYNVVDRIYLGHMGDGHSLALSGVGLTFPVITLIAAVCFLCWAAWKGIRKLIAYLKTVDWFATRDDADLEEYEDTRESLVDIRDLPKEYLRRMGDWLSDRLKREPSWSDLKTNAEKARALYRRTLLKARAGGYKENAAYTPSQTLKAVIPHVKVSPQSLDTLRDCYEQARYGEREPDGEAVEALNREI